MLLLGASVRAVAASCGRAGIACVGADLFADTDAQQLAAISQVVEYPKGLGEFAEQLPPSDWLFTGGLENYPQLISKISRRHRLLWNDEEAVSRVRNPVELSRLVCSAGLPSPATTLTLPADENSQQWLRKPRKSCGGTNVTFVNATATTEATDVYYQAYIEGTPVGALFVGQAGAARLLGVTRQLVGPPWTSAVRYQYAGSVGPIHMESDVHQQLQHVGDLLAHDFRLRGLFGVDGILNEHGFWTVEVNPRYTASVEIWERATGQSAIAAHIAACTDAGSQAAPAASANTLAESCHGKAIVYADTDARVEHDFARLVEQLNRSGESSIADIPHFGTTILKGRPVCTVLAAGKSETQVMGCLKQRAQQVKATLTDH